MQTIPQGSTVRPVEDFAFRLDGKGRTITFRKSAKLWVASSAVRQSQNGTIEICRKSQPMGTGYHFTMEQFCKLFKVC